MADSRWIINLKFYFQDTAFQTKFKDYTKQLNYINSGELIKPSFSDLLQLKSPKLPKEVPKRQVLQISELPITGRPIRPDPTPPHFTSIPLKNSPKFFKQNKKSGCV